MSHAACAAAWAASDVMASAFRAHRMVVGAGEAAIFACRPGTTAVARVVRSLCYVRCLRYSSYRRTRL